MPTPSKFTAENRQKIYQALQVGASRRTAAHIAGVDESQIRRWFKRGEDASEGRYREFYEEVLRSEASPRMRALGVVYKELPDNPSLAWKFIERREPGYEPPLPNIVPQAAPVVIALSFADGSPALPDWIDVGVVDDQESPALPVGDGDAAAGSP